MATSAEGWGPSRMLYKQRKAATRLSFADVPSSEACLGSAVAVCPASAAAAVSPASAAAAVRVFAAIAEFVAGGAALPAAFSLHRLSVAPDAGVPAPAFAGASVVPVPALRIAFLAAADTSGLASGCPCLEHWVVQQVEDREDGRACWVEKHCSLDGSPDAKLSHWCAPDFCHDSLEEYKAHPPLWPVRRRGL